MSLVSALVLSGLVSIGAKEWIAVEGTSATTLVGVGAQSDERAVGAAAMNGVGAVVERYDGSVWGKEPGTGAGLLLDAAVGSTYTVAASVLPILVSDDDGKTYRTVEGLGSASQSAHVIDDTISLVGGFVIPEEDSKPTTKYGVARSSDGGVSWKVSEVADGDCRYGAFPSEDVWYVSNGMWDEDPPSRRLSAQSYDLGLEAARLRSMQDYPLSARARVNGLQKGGVSFQERSSASRKENSTATGWWGTISKTVDGGETFSTVFSSDLAEDFYYFNTVACSSDTHCIAVAEGDNPETGGYLVLAFVTFDGGETWTNVLNEDNTPSDVVSIMGAAWVDDQEGWLGATAKDRTQLNGVFFHTTDGGKTFQVEETLPNCFLMDLTFANGVGYAACSTSSGSNGYVAMYV